MRQIVFGFLLVIATAAVAQAPQPIIDVHRHASWPWNDDTSVAKAHVALLQQHNIVRAVLAISEPDNLDSWVSAYPGLFIAGPMMPCPRNGSEPFYKCFPETDGWPDIDWFEAEIETGRLQVLHELAFNYSGINPSDPRLAPYWALAAEHDLPVGVHTGRGPPPDAVLASTRGLLPDCCPDYDKEMGNPALLRPVLERHRGLRLWIQHIGAGRGDHDYHWDEALALLKDYPNIYAELSVTNTRMPLEQYAQSLRRLIDAGMGDRIMFGSDNQPLDLFLERFAQLDFLDESQRRAILHDNAARFFRLDDNQEQGARSDER